MSGLPGLPVFGFQAEAGLHLLRLVIRPLVVGLVVVALAVMFLLAGRSLAPFVVGGGIGHHAQLTSVSDERARAERELQAEADLLLESFESSHPAVPGLRGERP